MVSFFERRDPSQGAMLRTWLDGHVMPAFSGRILVVDAAVAQCCAKLHDVSDFAPTGVDTLNLWIR